MASARSLRRTRERTAQAAARLKDLAVAGLITLLGVAVWIETSTWTEARNLSQDPTVLPRSLAVILWLVAIGMVVRVARSRLAPTESTTDSGKPAAADPPAAADTDDTTFVGALVALFGAAAYTWIGFRLGWVVTTWLCMVGAVLAMTDRRLTARRVAMVAAIAALIVAVVWFGFVELLSVRMPTTLLP